MGDRSSAIEREVKLAAWAGLGLPDLNDVCPGVSARPLPSLRLMAIYYDTADLRLARWGVTVRHRSAEVVPSANGARTETAELAWTIKIGVADAPQGGLTRRELGFAGSETKVPSAVQHIVRGLARGAPLVPVARLRTERLRWRLTNEGHKEVCEVDDDEVSVLVGRRLAARFRELEVELAPGADPEILDAVVAKLREVGAGAEDPTPKVVRALGPRAVMPPDVVVERVGRKATAAEVVRAAIASSVDRLFRHDPGVRLGEDAEDVHQARVATRRLRSDLRTFGALLDEEWNCALRDELAWIAGLLGEVRDTDVLLERLRQHVARLAVDDQKAADALLKRLGAKRDRVRAELLAAIDTPRYTGLLDRLVDAARAPVFVACTEPPIEPATEQPTGSATGSATESAAGSSTDPAAESAAESRAQPAAEHADEQPQLQTPPQPQPASSGPHPDDVAIDVLPALVRKPWKHLQRTVDELGDQPADDDLHEVRIRAKRCRYASEAVAPVVGKPASALAAGVAELQGFLGDFHDAIVAEAWLREAVARAPAAQALAAGQVIAIERAEAQRGRDGWEALWKKASSKKLRAWLA